jgi:hypothetical protein
MTKYIVVNHPRTYDTSVTGFDDLDVALEFFTEYWSGGASPILAQVLDVSIETSDMNEKTSKIRCNYENHNVL